MNSHVRINEVCEVAALSQNWTIFLLHDQRSAGPADEIHQAGLFQTSVIKPERSGPPIPAAQVEIGLGEFQRIEYDVMRGPVLGGLDAQEIEIEAAAAGEQLDLRGATKLLGLDAQRNVILPKGPELELLHDTRWFAFGIADDGGAILRLDLRIFPPPLPEVGE